MWDVMNNLSQRTVQLVPIAVLSYFEKSKMRGKKGLRKPDSTAYVGNQQ